MSCVMQRGEKFYLRYFDAGGTRRTRLARGAMSEKHAREMLAEIDRGLMMSRIAKRYQEDERAIVIEYERWEHHHCPTCGRLNAPSVF